MSLNILVKTNLDNYLENKKKTEHELTFEQRKELLFNYCNINNKIPLSKDVENNGDWYDRIKEKIKSKDDLFYKELSKNDLIKNNLDNLFKFRENKILEPTKEEKIKKMFEYCQTNKKIPSSKDTLNYGTYLKKLKEKIKSKEDELYIELSQNEIVKKSIDDLLEKRKNK